MKGLRKILYLAANPVGTDRLGLDEEYRGIRDQIERGKYRRRFELVRCLAMPRELPEELHRHKPVAVHFSCHGYRADEPTLDRGLPHRDIAGRYGNEDGLIVSDTDGGIQLISNTAVEETFGVDGSSVKLAVLAACYTDALAAALLTNVDCVVGMSGPIHDDAARHFATGFYKGIVEGESVQEAYRRGRLAIRLANLGGDVDRPQLKFRNGVDATKLILAANLRPSRPRR